MTTTILILCFSAVAITLVTTLSIRSQRTSERVMYRIMETLTDTNRITNTTTQSVSSDMVDLVVKEGQQTKKTMVDLFLGRELQVQQSESQSEPTERQPTPGIETLEGLPKNVVDALNREYQESNPQEWQVVLGTPSNGSESSSEFPSPDLNSQTP
jgi:hypothetical protein